ncbi:phage head-tail connector protein [Rummeliibacillus sp. BSL5]
MWTPTDEEVCELIAINDDISTPERVETYKILAPIYLDYAIDYCNQELTVENSNVKVFIAKAIQFYTQKAGLTARSMGSVSYSYATDLPSSILKPLKPFKKLRW